MLDGPFCCAFIYGSTSSPGAAPLPPPPPCTIPAPAPHDTHRPVFARRDEGTPKQSREVGPAHVRTMNRGAHHREHRPSTPPQVATSAACLLATTDFPLPLGEGQDAGRHRPPCHSERSKKTTPRCLETNAGRCVRRGPGRSPPPSTGACRSRGQRARTGAGLPRQGCHGGLACHWCAAGRANGCAPGL